jgi:hypothetical protein
MHLFFKRISLLSKVFVVNAAQIQRHLRSIHEKFIFFKRTLCRAGALTISEFLNHLLIPN